MTNDDLKDILCAKIDDVRTDVSVLNKLLTGNGNPETGLVVRVDRIEQDRKVVRFWSRTFVATIIVQIIGAAFAGVAYAVSRWP